MNSSELSVKICPGNWNGGRNPRRHDAVSAASLLSVGNSATTTNIHLAL